MPLGAVANLLPLAAGEVQRQKTFRIPARHQSRHTRLNVRTGNAGCVGLQGYIGDRRRAGQHLQRPTGERNRVGITDRR